MKIDKHEFFMRLAQSIALVSHAERNQVGALIEKDGNSIAFGYNGTPAGFSNLCEDAEGNTKREVLHAESNAIAKCARTGVSCQDAIMYTTVSPCFECAKLIVQSGIAKVYYKEDYRDLSGLSLLNKAGIETIRI